MSMNGARLPARLGHGWLPRTPGTWLAGRHRVARLGRGRPGGAARRRWSTRHRPGPPWRTPCPWPGAWSAPTPGPERGGRGRSPGPVVRPGSAALPAAVTTLQAAARRGLDVAELLARTTSRTANAEAFTAAYRRYVWPTSGLNGVQIAPFQLLASQDTVFSDRDHGWHLALADRLVQAAPTLIRTTKRLPVDTTEPDSVEAGVRWWQDLTAGGGEGMVVKP